MNSEIKVNPEDGDQICVEHRVIDNPKKKIISKNMMHSRSCIDGSKGNHLLEGNRYNVKKKTIKRGNKNITNTMFVEGKDNITQFQQVRFDPTLQYVVTDSGEYADVSDNFIDDDTNNSSQDRLSVTSITFMRQLKNAIPIRKLYRKRKLRKIYRFRQKMSRNNMFDFEQVSNIEDNMMNDNKNDLDCDVLYCSELVKDDNSEIES
nr:PREDICTED: uncharacterized protein LOC105663362 isoform X1 [Megachile rotundata]